MIYTWGGEEDIVYEDCINNFMRKMSFFFFRDENWA